MSRSGTSLTVRVLNLLGVDLGTPESLIPGNEQNVKGYWEQRPIFEVNEAVLAALGGTYANPPVVKPGWERSPRLTLLKRRAAELLDETFGSAPLKGFKDPRVALTLPFWRELVPHMRYAICIRNPVDVARSYERFTGGGESARSSAIDLWVRSTASALVHTSGSSRIVVFYEDFFIDLRGEVERLAELIERPVPEDAFAEIEAFVDAGLRNHRSSADAVAGDDPAAQQARALYGALRALAPRPSEEAMRRVEELARAALVALDRTAAGGEPSGTPCAAAPFAIRKFPDDLANVDSFGIHKDGWLDRISYAVIAAGGPADLVVRANVLPLNEQRLDVLVDGRAVASTRTTQGLVYVRSPLRSSRSRRHVELRWADAQRLDAPDGRCVAARLRSLRLVPKVVPERDY